ncbi:MAG TPA: VCBS repeat-containing protein [Planctomycetota bacterium]|nr:VCBS repeat-containing protein [Planctomycetota bacterium]
MRYIHALCVACVVSSIASAQLSVVAIDPPLNANNRAANDSVVVDFDRALDPSSLGNVRLYGNVSGAIAGTQTLENGGTRLRFRPERPYFANEIVTTNMNENLKAQDGSFLRTQGFVASFRIATAPALRQFNVNATWSVSPSVFARIYGGQTCDLNDDDFSDLAIVCENASDVRIFLSNHDATGSFGPLLNGPYPAGNTPSPNENADMNGDGLIDIVTCDNFGGTASIFLGNGDGSLQPSVSYMFEPGGVHGMAIFDADGDGDSDVALAGGDKVHLRLNNGSGVLGPVTSTTTSVSGDYGLSYGDMDNDGIVDLVVGASSGGGVMVLKSNGAGGFTPKPVQNSAGFCWMIACGDLNNDGNIDVSIANGPSGYGTVLLGNGDGTLQAPFSTTTVGHMAATDLGDLDGDGDLDWVLSSFGGGVYQLWRNNGNGTFTFDQTIPGVQNPACCSMLDIDGDRDLDLALFDETTDMVTIRENGALDAMTVCEGTLAGCPCANLGLPGHGCENSIGAGGALLLAQGRASVGNDSLALNVGGMPANARTIVLQGTAPAAGATPIYDGLLCVGGTIKRFPAQTASNGYVHLDSANAGAPLSSIGNVPPGGGVFYYQVWYRDSQPFCTSGGANTSNAVRVTWTP